MNTFYENKDEQKGTWKSPSDDKNEVDFIISNRCDIIFKKMWKLAATIERSEAELNYTSEVKGTNSYKKRSKI